MHVFFGAVILACLGLVTLVVLLALWAETDQGPMALEAPSAELRPAVRILERPYDWADDADLRGGELLIIIDDPITDRVADPVAIDAWLQTVKYPVPHGSFTVEAIEPGSPEWYMNAADAHCELCDGRGIVAEGPCPCTKFGTPAEDSLRYYETH